MRQHEPPDAGPPHRVLVVAPQPISEDRGTPIAVRELVSALVRLGYEVDLATFPVGRPLEMPGVRMVRALRVPGIRRVPIGFSVRKLVLDVLLFATTYRLLRRRRYHSVHGVEEGGFFAALLGPRFGVRVVYDMQSSLPDQMRRHLVFRSRAVQRVLRACERWLLRRADVVMCSTGLGERVRQIAPSANVREWLYPAPLGETVAGEAEALRKELWIPLDAPVVVYAGTFEAYQGLFEVLGAIPAVCRKIPGTVFVLVGAERRNAVRLARHAKRLGLNGSLRIIERRPREQIHRFLAMADVLLAPRATGQNLPLKLFHYMAAGRPIVATGPGCGHTMLGEGRALVAPHSSPAIAAAISRLLADRALAADLAAGAQAFAASELDPSHFARSIVELCAQMPIASEADVE